jgi:hypothetical protein
MEKLSSKELARARAIFEGFRREKLDFGFFPRRVCLTRLAKVTEEEKQYLRPNVRYAIYACGYVCDYTDGSECCPWAGSDWGDVFINDICGHCNDLLKKGKDINPEAKEYFKKANLDYKSMVF